MGVFNFGDPTNRRPAWHADAWPKRRGVRGVVEPGYHPAADAKPVASTPTDSAPRVLVVDDNPIHRMLASEMLALWGIEPLLAVDGQEAVTFACEIPLALILMDIRMPVLDGLAATRQIRRFELERSRPRVPIVAYTSDAFGTPRLRLQDFGIDALLAKPCAANELHECLLRWCPAAAVPAAVADIRHAGRD